jgi:muramoyltetrapeptide carboxypeptidase LdcA involved in peptidoglycan recycling
METKAIFPRAPRKGDTIAFISPSARRNSICCAPLDRAKAYLESLDYHVKIIYSDISSLSHKESILARCDEIHSAFANPSITAIICTIGGSSSNELLKHLNYALIRSHPKIFCGYSDITVLHYAFFTQASLRTFYGPAAIKELGDYPQPLEFTASHFLAMLTEEGRAGVERIGPVPRSLEWTPQLPELGPKPRPRELAPNPGWTWLRPCKASGRIFGGCLPSILHLAGTKFWPDYKGRILLLESPMGEQMDKPLPLMATRAQMANLGNLGVFDVIAGLVVGRPFGLDEGGREEFRGMMEGVLEGTSFPVLLDVDVGHTAPILTIPLDALCSLDSKKDEFSILEAGVVGS